MLPRPTPLCSVRQLRRSRSILSRLLSLSFSRSAELERYHLWYHTHCARWMCNPKPGLADSFALLANASTGCICWVLHIAHCIGVDTRASAADAAGGGAVTCGGPVGGIALQGPGSRSYSLLHADWCIVAQDALEMQPDCILYWDDFFLFLSISNITCRWIRNRREFDRIFFSVKSGNMIHENVGCGNDCNFCY